MSSPDSIGPSGVPIGPLSGQDQIVETGPMTEQLPADEGGVSTIEKSKSVQIPYFLLLMDIPILFPPSRLGDDVSITGQITDLLHQAGIETMTPQDINFAAAVLLQFQDVQHEIGDSILDKWAESLQEIDEEIRRILESPAYQQMLQMHNANYLANQEEVQGVKTPAEITQDQEERTSVQSVFTHTNRVLHAVHASGVEPSAAPIALAALTLVSVPMATGVVGADPAVTHVAETTAAQAATQTVQMVPSNMAAELGLIGALMMTPLLVQSNWNIGVGQMGRKGGDVDLQFAAQEFARQVLQLGLKEGFMASFLPALVETIPSQAMKGEKLSREELIAIARLILAVVAMGWLFAAEQGRKKIPLEDLAAMLRGEVPIPEEDVLKHSLLTMIRSQMSLLSKEHLARVIEGILVYLESMPSPKKAFRPSTTLREAIRTMQRYRGENSEGERA